MNNTHREANARAIRNHQGMMLYALLYTLQQQSNFPTEETHKKLQFMVQGELNELGLPNIPTFDDNGIAKIDYTIYGYPKGFSPDKYIFGDNNSEGNGVIKETIQNWLISIESIAQDEENLTWFNILKGMPEIFNPLK